MTTSGRRTARPLPRRSKPPAAPKKTAIGRVQTAKEMRASGYRDSCDICSVQIGTKRRGKKVEIWSFTVRGAKGKIFNRCKMHLGRPCR